MTFLENTRKEYHKIKESPNRARERDRISTLIPRAELLVVVEEGSSGQSSSLALRENLSRGDTNEKNMNQSAVCLFCFPMPDPPSNRLDPPLMFCHCLFPSSVQVVSSTKTMDYPPLHGGFSSKLHTSMYNRSSSIAGNLCSSLSHHLHHSSSTTRIRLLLQPPQMFF